MQGQKDPLEKEMATHSSVLTWEIPWTEEPHGLQSMGMQRVRHDRATEHTSTEHKSEEKPDSRSDGNAQYELITGASLALETLEH